MKKYENERNNINRDRYHSFDIFKNNSKDENFNKISNIRRYLNNYYQNKYKQNLIKKNSSNYTIDYSPANKEINYYDFMKKNLLEGLINDENVNKNNNNNCCNNLSPNININININPNNISNQKVDINSNRNTINQDQIKENNDKNSLQLLTPSFTKRQEEKNEEIKVKSQKNDKQTTFKFNELNEIHNFTNNYSFIPNNPDSNNMKFPIYFCRDYTFKNMNIIYRNKLTKKALDDQKNYSYMENHQNIFSNKNQSNKQQINYNINHKKRKDDLFQLLNFSQHLGS